MVGRAGTTNDAVEAFAILDCISDAVASLHQAESFGLLGIKSLQIYLVRLFDLSCLLLLELAS